MAYINWLIEAANRIDQNEKDTMYFKPIISEHIQSKPRASSISPISDISSTSETVYQLVNLVQSHQSRSKNGKFLPKKYDETQSKYVGVYQNEKRWTVYINKEKYRFNTKIEAEKFFVKECKNNNVDIKSKLRNGWTQN
jgi:hypothetical protein